MSTAPSENAFARHVVTAVIVAHNGGRWLPQACAGLSAQTRAPQRFVAVDTGSGDGSRALLTELLGPRRVVTAPPGTGFGAAVRTALDSIEDGRASDGVAPAAGVPATADAPVEWLWLLHDDVEPEPTALEALLRFVDTSPSVAIAGPKIRGWHNRRLLLEVGVTIARSGRRETGLERREEDQGQHDTVRDVLAVSTAGMLVRRDVWDQLGGLDAELPLFRDDVDLGWRANLAGHRVVCVPDAVVHHAEASAHGRRSRTAVDRVRRTDRRNATYVLLCNVPALLVPWTVLRLTAGTLLRAFGLLVGKLPRNALDEVSALAAVLGRPDRLFRARRARRRTRAVSPWSARRLLATPGSGLRHGLEAVTAAVGVGSAASYAAGRHRVSAAAETGPASEDAEDLPTWRSDLLGRLLRRPPVTLVLVLLVVALLAGRDLLGAGRLMGGALLPAPDSAGDLWRTYTQSWHPVGLGSDTPAPPYLAVVAVLGTLLLGHVSTAVSLLLLGVVPLSGLTAYVALRQVVASPVLRLWGAVAYALLPAVPGAVAAGRLGTAAVAVLLPLAGIAAGRALVRGSRRAGWTGGLLLAVITAFTPVVYLMALVLAGVAVALRWLPRRPLVPLLALVLVPPVVLVPWLPALVERPSLLLGEGGLVRSGLADASLPPVAVLLLHPGGPGMYPVVFTLGLLLAALGALLRPDRRRLIVAGWACALVGMAFAFVIARARVEGPAAEGAVLAWAGPATLVAGAGLVLAAVVGAEGARGRLAGRSFGWRQVSVSLVTVLAAAMPLLAGGWWAVQGADGPLVRRDPVLLPAFVAAEGNETDRPRTLVLRRRPGGELAYTVLRAEGPRLGDADTADASQTDGLDDVVADLATGRGGDAAAALLPYGVRFVLVDRPVPAALADALDGVPGLVRLSGRTRSVLWKVRYPSGRARVVPAGSSGDSTTATVVPAGPVGVRADLPPGPGRRLLVLADRSAPGWVAEMHGRRLPVRTFAGWAEAFVVPSDGGRVEVSHRDNRRQLLLWLQAAAVVLVVVLALPSAREADAADQAPRPPAHGAARSRP